MGGGLVHGCNRRHENGAIALASTLAGLVAGIRLVPALALAALRPEAAAGVGFVFITAIPCFWHLMHCQGKSYGGNLPGAMGIFRPVFCG